MTVPDEICAVLATMAGDISFGFGGIHIASVEELPQAQVGYSVHPDGTSLCTGEPGAWSPEWLAIGNETGCGDPLFIDLSKSAYPVFTAMQGEGLWEPRPVAPSLASFAQCLAAFAVLAKDRSDPVAIESRQEVAEFLGQIEKATASEQYLQFWMDIPEIYDAVSA